MYTILSEHIFFLLDSYEKSMLIPDSKEVEGFIKFGCILGLFTKEFQYSIWWKVKKSGTCFILEMTVLRDKLTIIFKFMVDTKWRKTANCLSGFNCE